MVSSDCVRPSTGVRRRRGICFTSAISRCAWFITFRVKLSSSRYCRFALFPGGPSSRVDKASPRLAWYAAIGSRTLRFRPPTWTRSSSWCGKHPRAGPQTNSVGPDNECLLSTTVVSTRNFLPVSPLAPAPVPPPAVQLHNNFGPINCPSRARVLASGTFLIPDPVKGAIHQLAAPLAPARRSSSSGMCFNNRTGAKILPRAFVAFGPTNAALGDGVPLALSRTRVPSSRLPEACPPGGIHGSHSPRYPAARPRCHRTVVDDVFDHGRHPNHCCCPNNMPSKCFITF